jgi:hypothetical protein
MFPQMAQIAAEKIFCTSALIGEICGLKKFPFRLF